MDPVEPDTGAAPGIDLPWFIAYKFFNSLFLGLSIGSVFVLYSPLSPSVFSAGGIGLALGTLMIATQYHWLFAVDWFFRVSMLVELVILVAVIGVLLYPLSAGLALGVYVGYQLTFAFGSYLVRCETLLIPNDHRLTLLDVAKQAGYLVGMACSWGFYTVNEAVWQISDKTEQVLLMHWPLLGVELLIVILLYVAFRDRHAPSSISAEG